MKKSEVAMLLAYKHSLEDGNEPTQVEVAAWHDTVGDLDYQEAMLAARDHYRDAPTDYTGRAPRLMPRHLVEACEQHPQSVSYAGNVTELRLAAEALAVGS